jgi:hypothetical protein
MKKFGTIGWMLAGVVFGQAQGHFSYSTVLSGINQRPVPVLPSLAIGGDFFELHNGFVEYSLDWAKWHLNGRTLSRFICQNSFKMSPI